MYTITNDANQPLFNTDRFDTAMGWLMDRAAVTTPWQRNRIADALCNNTAPEVFVQVHPWYILHYAPN